MSTSAMTVPPVALPTTASARKQLLFFTSFPPPYTGQTVATKQIYSLMQPTFDVDRISISDPNRLEREGGAFNGRYAVQLVKHTAALRRRLRAEAVHGLYVVLSSSRLGHLRDLAYLSVARPHVRRVVAHIHSGAFQNVLAGRFGERRTRALTNLVDVFCFSSPSLYVPAAGLIPREQVRFVPNTASEQVRVDRSVALQKVAARQKRTEFHAVYISNMIPSKGYEDVAMGLAIARREHGLPLRADFVGGWPSEQARAQFDAMLADEGLSDVVTVHGAVHDRPWIRERLLSADAFLLPTYYPVEAQPLSIIEALNAATPVISTHHASIPDYIRNDENGYLVGKKSPAEIAEALRRLHDLPTWSRLARNARDTFDSTFGPEVIRSAFLEAFAL